MGNPPNSDAEQLLMDVISSEKKLNVVLLGSGDRRPQIIPEAERLKSAVKRYANIVLEDFEYSSSLKLIDADFAIVFGGDGSILRAAKWMGSDQIPVLGVNLGKLGFLADISPDILDQALCDLVSGKFRIVEHLMIRCEVFDGDSLIADELGLNELAVLGGPPYAMQQLELYVDNELATTYSCDGLIISSPIGSTAHNLSVGGPILRKNLEAFVISPISPHTLTVRPVVDRADRTYEIVVRNPNQSTSAVLDGQVVCHLSSNHRVRITRAEPVFQLLEIQGQNYYRTLREKLGWGGEFKKRKN